MKSRSYLMVLPLLLLTLCLAAPAQALVKPGKMLPALTLPDTAGKTHALAELTKDKVALVVYWSVTCPHCQAELPHLLILAKQLEGNPFVLVLINTDGQAMAKVVEAYAAEQRMPPPLLVDHGPKDSLPFADAFDIVATPGVLLFDRTGKLVWAQELTVDLPSLKKAIEAAF